ncbi:hypothetical protein BC567DRAFT_208759 [Phyllosticta citribraziliensis]
MTGGGETLFSARGEEKEEKGGHTGVGHKEFADVPLDADNECRVDRGLGSEGCWHEVWCATSSAARLQLSFAGCTLQGRDERESPRRLLLGSREKLGFGDRECIFFGWLRDENEIKLPAMFKRQQHVAHKQTSIHLQEYEETRGTALKPHSRPPTEGAVEKYRGRVNRAHMRRAVDRGKKKDGLHTREGKALQRWKRRRWHE